MAKVITAEELMNLGTSKHVFKEDRERMKQCASGRDVWSALDILRLEGIGNVHKLWLVLRPELIDDSGREEFARRCKSRTVSMTKDPDRYDNLVAAMHAIVSAAGAFADPDVWTAAWVSAWTAVEIGSDGASTAERQRQVSELIKMLEIVDTEDKPG